ncbi:hypothetical protein [Mesorhizobium sp. L-8-3]|uniref:hypothetical protein n=1 Tax=Mesorhizobium sp. L-8-3 TaxID=2744522 RepID=UPI0019271293|nr:hypothetical protein [Mesorhizobium sp. L-8-3]BCH27355.1 hypothetical protein MesoLjLb_71400 [Mesorhizobium sp. L-8-3]
MPEANPPTPNSKAPVREALKSREPRYVDGARASGWIAKLIASVLGLATLVGAVFTIFGMGDPELKIEGLDVLPWVQTDHATGRSNWNLRTSLTVQKKWGVSLTNCRVLVNGHELLVVPSLPRFSAGQTVGFDILPSYYSPRGRNTAEMRCESDVSNLIEFRINDVSPTVERQEF